jgi:hypothetical protein
MITVVNPNPISICASASTRNAAAADCNALNAHESGIRSALGCLCWCAAEWLD